MLNIYDKVAAGGYAGLISTAVVGLLALIHVALPGAVVAAIVSVIVFATSYLKTETKLAPVIQAVESALPKAGE